METSLTDIYLALVHKKCASEKKEDTANPQKNEENNKRPPSWTSPTTPMRTPPLHPITPPPSGRERRRHDIPRGADLRTAAATTATASSAAIQRARQHRQRRQRRRSTEQRRKRKRRTIDDVVARSPRRSAPDVEPGVAPAGERGASPKERRGERRCQGKALHVRRECSVCGVSFSFVCLVYLLKILKKFK